MALLLICSVAHAELPLEIEGLFTNKGKFKLDLGLTYANTNRSEVTTSAPLTVQVGPTQFVTVPTKVGETRTNSDTLIATTGLHYGITGDTEIYGKATWLYDDLRAMGDMGQTSRTASGAS